jgi:hypothetical protein
MGTQENGIDDLIAQGVAFHYAPPYLRTDASSVPQAFRFPRFRMAATSRAAVRKRGNPLLTRPVSRRTPFGFRNISAGLDFP